MREAGFSKTPDAKLLVPIGVRGRVVTWIDSKASFGDNYMHRQQAGEQFQGCVWSLLSSLSLGVLVCNIGSLYFFLQMSSRVSSPPQWLPLFLIFTSVSQRPTGKRKVFGATRYGHRQQQFQGCVNLSLLSFSTQTIVPYGSLLHCSLVSSPSSCFFWSYIQVLSSFSCSVRRPLFFLVPLPGRQRFAPIPVRFSPTFAPAHPRRKPF